MTDTILKCLWCYQPLPIGSQVWGMQYHRSCAPAVEAWLENEAISDIELKLRMRHIEQTLETMVVSKPIERGAICLFCQQWPCTCTYLRTTP